MLLTYATVAAAAADAQARPPVSLQRFERWELHSAPGVGPQTKTALLLLFVRNETTQLLKHWQALLVVRDSSANELFRLAVNRDSADLEPGEVARVELQFGNRPEVPREPYDHLLGRDTADLHPSFDQVRIVSAAPARYLVARAPMCFTREAVLRVVTARVEPGQTTPWREVAQRAGCGWAQRRQAVEVLGMEGAHAARVRLKRMWETIWVVSDDLRSP